MTAEITKVKEQNKFLSRVYGWMTLALLISGVVAYAVANVESLFLLVYSKGIGFMVLAVAEIVLVWWLSASIRKISAFAATVAFVAYSVINGLTLSVIFVAYKITSIFMVFTISALMFAGMALYGSRTKSNLSSVGRYFMMALIGILIASVLNIFLRSGPLDWLISIVTVVLFTGLTAYDAQKMLRASESANGVSEDVFQKASVIGALELYLDFINIFLSLLRLFGKNKD